MEDKFVLKQVTEVSSNILKKNYFIRYDLRKEWSLYNNFINKFKYRNGTYPFVYEILQSFLSSLSLKLQKKVKDILHKKYFQWFIDVGQYLFYNLYQWIKNFNDIELNKKNILIEGIKNQRHKRQEFLEAWWTSFCKFEDKQNSKEFPISQIPEKILLEITNNCNLDCIMCGVGKNGYDPSRNFHLNLLYYLSDKILSKVKLIRLNGLGESTVIPNFLKYLDIICNLPARLEIVTNLTVQNQKIWDKLIEKETNFLISCGSSIAKKYEAIRRGAKFSSFVRNLKMIGSKISNPLQAQIIFTLMKENISDLLGVIELAREYGLGGVIVNVVKSNQNETWMEKYFDFIQELFQKAYDYSQNVGTVLKLPDHLGLKSINPEISTPSSSKFCENPWKEVYIRYNGDLTACNMLNPYIYGNCTNTPFEKVWNGLNANIFRHFVNSKFKHYYCRECYYLI